jgi:hypothetical protein
VRRPLQEQLAGETDLALSTTTMAPSAVSTELSCTAASTTRGAVLGEGSRSTTCPSKLPPGRYVLRIEAGLNDATRPRVTTARSTTAEI